MTATRRGLTAAALALASTATALATTGTAHAATPSSLCGSQYHPVASYAMTRDAGTNGPRTGGYVTVFYDPSNGADCAVAKPVAALAGRVNRIGVGVWNPKTRRGSSDGYGINGNFRWWAGPVYVAAKRDCINVAASMHYGRANYSATEHNVLCG